ncbi:hypothetical protein BRARA_I00897 [Brassica rapa]|uniref:Uncharacterized protein n=1 Tax=Brassica campestris TaxID=3711 RepID=A0A397XSJ9_BRACM|nr:hypothetical protein BRARA_I00897 [Brassica rapa]
MGFRPIFYIKKYKPVSTSTADDMASDVYLSHSHQAYTFKSYEDEANLSSKKQSKWFKNKKNMNKFKKTSVSLGNSLKSCLLLLLSCFHV